MRRKFQRSGFCFFVFFFVFFLMKIQKKKLNAPDFRYSMNWFLFHINFFSTGFFLSFLSFFLELNHWKNDCGHSVSPMVVLFEIQKIEENVKSRTWLVGGHFPNVIVYCKNHFRLFRISIFWKKNYFSNFFFIIFHELGFSFSTLVVTLFVIVFMSLLPLVNITVSAHISILNVAGNGTDRPNLFGHDNYERPKWKRKLCPNFFLRCSLWSTFFFWIFQM